MMDGWHDGWGSGWWILMPLFWIALIGAIIWAGTRLFPSRYDRDGDRGGEGLRETPQQVLDRRLASGEIDVATYDELREKLRAARSGGE